MSNHFPAGLVGSEFCQFEEKKLYLKKEFFTYLHWARVFLVVGLHFTYKNFKVQQLGKIKIKFEFEPKMYKINGTSDVIYIADIYSKKEVQKKNLMCNYSI